jgi:hypothetical protein
MGLREWLKASWEPMLGYLNNFFILAHRWMDIIFKTMEDLKRILELVWKWVSTMLYLK